MHKNFFHRGFVALAVALLTFGLVTRAQAANSSVLLEDAYATLAQAKHDYKGHRVRAMKQIELALNENGKIAHTGKVHEPQATSDAQMRAAENLLSEARGQLSGKALKHVNQAITQINDGLAIK